MARTRAETAEALAPLCSSDSYPALTSDDLLRIVDSCQRVSVHIVSTAYQVGDMVIPSTPNGRQYRCIRAGTSSSTAPTWIAEPSLQYTGQIVADGADLLWQDDGPTTQERYDLRLAAYRAWLEKAGRTATDIAVSDMNKTVQLQQVHEHCVAMASRYRPMVIL